MRESSAKHSVQLEAISGDSQLETVKENPALDTGRRRNPALRNSISVQCDREIPTTFYSRFGKRAFDLAISVPAVVVLLVPMLLIALAIKIDSRGPAMFRQERTGQFGRRFAMFKFRSMVEDAEHQKAALQEQNVHGAESPDFKLVDDPRITRIGRFLRKTSIDELPNLLNVVLGDMSLVGPRPTSFDSSTYGFSHLPRLGAKPGITGVWQVSGRANVDFDRRAKMDTYYIDDINFIRDIKLLVKTVIGGSRGAY